MGIIATRSLVPSVQAIVVEPAECGTFWQGPPVRHRCRDSGIRKRGIQLRWCANTCRSGNPSATSTFRSESPICAQSRSPSSKSSCRTSSGPPRKQGRESSREGVFQVVRYTQVSAARAEVRESRTLRDSDDFFFLKKRRETVRTKVRG